MLRDSIRVLSVEQHGAGYSGTMTVAKKVFDRF